MADGDDVVGDFFVVEDLSDAVGLRAVVVVLGIRGFGGAAEAEEVEDDEGVREGEEGGDCACPHVGVIGVAVEEHEGWDVFV